MSLRIRAATAGDEALVLDFIRALADYEKLLHEVRATPKEVQRAFFGPNPRAFCDIAEWNGTPAGFAVWFFNYSTFLGQHGIYLEDLFVKPEMRGHGIGKHLLAHLARRAVEENCGRLDWAVLDWNAPSIAFYKSLGAVAMDEWTGYRLTGDALANLARQT